MSTSRSRRSPRVGRPQVIDKARIVAAALVICRERGLSGVTLQGVARSLGVSSSALRRYVGSRAELLDSVAAGVVQDTKLPAIAADGNERGWLSDFGIAFYDQLTRHQGVPAHLVNRGLVIGPSWSLARRFEQVLMRAGVEHGGAAASSLTILSVICGRAALSTALERQSGSERGRRGIRSGLGEVDFGADLDAFLSDLLNAVLPRPSSSMEVGR